MDWIIPAITALAGLGGATIGMAGVIITQRAAERNETTRHARRLAYEAAITAWREHRDTFNRTVDPKSGRNVETEIQPLQDFIIAHLIFADATLKDIHASATTGDIETLMRSTRECSIFMRKYRNTLIEEGAQLVKKAAH
jgi:hypothetical protein